MIVKSIKRRFLFKRMAKLLPSKHRVYYKKGVVKGHFFIGHGLTHFDRTPVIYFKDYVVRFCVREEIDHYKRLKRVFRKNGNDGVLKYVVPMLKPSARQWFKNYLETI